ncbi:NAD(P)-binding protein [Lentithecium fluviatile CBS 122367]|uniref:NAD(P)-binding protein n=1 Tax=Lentithecium fluviatile CBS 122367 TaxID=1168545 RepID=A0A6G1J4M7_9PLEO|nr:NAD(P)-binding protein [Lentithecium fluviatile CBS 122367]
MASNHIKKVAIVGATGQVGKFIVASLLEKNTFTITALTRAGSSTTPPSGVHLSIVDYDNPSTLTTALKNQDALIITMSVNAPPDQSAKLIEAAAKAGVPWILPNEFGTNTDGQAGKETGVAIPKQKNRQLIEKLGVSSWIGIATSFWYEYSLAGPSLYGIDIAKREVVWFDDGKHRIHTSTWPQVGRAVANLLSLPVTAEGGDGKSVTLDSYRNEFVYISSFTLNQREMLDAVQRVTGTTDKDWKMESTTAKERFDEGRMRMAQGERVGFAHALYARLFFPGETAGLYGETHGLDNEKLGLPEEDLDEFTKESVKMAESGYFAKLFGSG